MLSQNDARQPDIVTSRYGIDEEPQESVRDPSYYTMGGVECIDIIKEVLGYPDAIAFCKGNILKYRIRLGLKYKPGTKGFEDDIAKISKYIEMKNRLEKEWIATVPDDE